MILIIIDADNDAFQPPDVIGGHQVDRILQHCAYLAASRGISRAATHDLKDDDRQIVGKYIVAPGEKSSDCAEFIRENFINGDTSDEKD